jgi:hypothetical protein
MKIKDNIIKSWKTSLIGFIILVCAILSVFLEDRSWSEIYVTMSIGISLLFAPDTIINKIIKFFKPKSDE